MYTAYVIVTVMAAIAVSFTVAADVFLRERVLPNMDRAGVPRAWLPRLAAARAAGALGLLVGIWVPLIGIAAALGIVLYFVGAIITHVRARWYDISYPSIYLLLATGSLGLALPAA